MKQVLQNLPLALATIVGGFSAYTGWRYIVFFSGGSGFVVPVPAAVVILFFAGVTLLIAGALAYWLPRFSAALAVVCLLVLLASLVQQTLVDPRRSEVILKRGVIAALFAAIACAVYFVNFRRVNEKKTA